MVNTIRHSEFFDPSTIQEDIHIIGVGAVGSHIAEFLVRLGIEEINIWDFDVVDDHNIPNQKFRHKDIGKKKTSALKKQLEEINPEVVVHCYQKYEDQEINGYIFACVDNIEVRKELYESNIYNVGLKAVFDTRVALKAGQIFSADWSNETHKDNLLAVSEFSHDEAEEDTAACGTKLAVLPTMVQVSNLAVTNFMNFIIHGELKPMITFNIFNMKFNT